MGSWHITQGGSAWFLVTTQRDRIRYGGGWEGSLRGRRHVLEKEIATHSSSLAWKIPWTEEPGRLQSMSSERVGHYWATEHMHMYTYGWLMLFYGRNQWKYSKAIILQLKKKLQDFAQWRKVSTKLNNVLNRCLQIIWLKGLICK